MAKPKLSIIIPNYNEKNNLDRGVLTEVADYLATAPFTWEVIISDDGSTDGSLPLLQAFVKKNRHFKLLNNPHGGKAHAVNAGIQAAQGEIVLYTDMDQSTPLPEVDKLLPYYDQGFDVVFGSRGHRRNTSLFRRFASLVFLSIRRSLVLPHISDTQCGFKSFKTLIAKQIFPMLEIIRRPPQATGWVVTAFDVELLFIANKKGYRLKEVPVTWRDRDTSTSKSRNFISESIDMFKQIIRVKKNDLRGFYN